MSLIIFAEQGGVTPNPLDTKVSLPTDTVHLPPYGLDRMTNCTGMEWMGGKRDG